MFRAKWITANGHTYKKDAVVWIGVSRGVPKFGKITAVYLVNEQEVALQVKVVETEQFLEHYHAYSVFTSHHLNTKLLHSLSLPNPMHLHRLHGKQLIILPHHVHLDD